MTDQHPREIFIRRWSRLDDIIAKYRVAQECINTKVPTKSDVLVIFLHKLAACALQRQMRVFIDRLQESFLLARLRI